MIHTYIYICVQIYVYMYVDHIGLYVNLRVV